MFRRALVFIVMMLGLFAMAAAQQDACKNVEIPVGVINSGGESFRGLATQDFLARTQKGSVSVKSIAYDIGPRRVLLVVDTSRKLPANLRRAEVELLKTFLAAIRPEDSVGLLTALGPGGPVKFGDTRASITEAVAGETNSTQGKNRGVLDAVSEGVEWFADPHAGDAIVVIAPNTEGNHKSNAKSVAKALADHHIRMFGLALGPIQTRNPTASAFTTSTTSQGLALSTPDTGVLTYSLGDEDFYPLTSNSGGLVAAVVDPDSKKFSDKMDSPSIQQFVRSRAQLVANAVDSFYRMLVEPQPTSHQEWWSLDLTQDIRKNSPAMFLLYPHSLGPC
ncbi:MAG TPA: hypothetical protein VIX19_10410 [Terriglobales bacterium]